MKVANFYGAILSFALGVGLATPWQVDEELILFLLLLSLGIGILWRRSRTVTEPYLFGLSLCLVFCAFGLFRTELYAEQFGVSPLRNTVGEEVRLEGFIIREPDYRERTVHLSVQVAQDILLVTTDRAQQFSYGDVVSVSGVLREPESFTTEFGRTFDYPGYLLAKGIEYTISFAEVSVVKRNQGNVALSYLYQLKGTFMESLEGVVNEPMAGLGEGLLLGVKQALGSDVESQFRKTGIIHIVVLSGYNVMLVAAFILFCFSFFLPLRYRIVCGIGAIGMFAFLVGLSATVVRASIMACLVLIAQLFQKRYDVLRGLFVAGFVMLLINPYLLLYDIGFQLSFLATFGLILFAPHFETVFVETRFVGVKSFVIATIATQIAVLPLLLYHIGEVSIVAIVVNVLVLPIVPLAMLLTFFTGLAGLVSTPLAALIAFPATLSLQYILWVAESFAKLPFAAVSVPAFGAWLMFFLYALYGILYFVYTKKESSEDVMAGWEIVEEDETGASESFDSLAPVSRSDLPPILR